MSLHTLGLLRGNCDAGHLPMEFSRTLTASDGARLAYRLWRPARSRGLLILLHGLASNATRWSEFVATTSLRENWDILRPDLRGQGASVHRGRMGMDIWCDDLAAIVNAARSSHQMSIPIRPRCTDAPWPRRSGRRMSQFSRSDVVATNSLQRVALLARPCSRMRRPRDRAGRHSR